MPNLQILVPSLVNGQLTVNAPDANVVTYVGQARDTRPYADLLNAAGRFIMKVDENVSKAKAQKVINDYQLQANQINTDYLQLKKEDAVDGFKNYNDDLNKAQNQVLENVDNAYVRVLVKGQTTQIKNSAIMSGVKHKGDQSTEFLNDQLLGDITLKSEQAALHFHDPDFEDHWQGFQAAQNKWLDFNGINDPNSDAAKTSRLKLNDKLFDNAIGSDITAKRFSLARQDLGKYKSRMTVDTYNDLMNRLQLAEEREAQHNATMKAARAQTRAMNEMAAAFNRAYQDTPFNFQVATQTARQDIAAHPERYAKTRDVIAQSQYSGLKYDALSEVQKQRVDSIAATQTANDLFKQMQSESSQSAAQLELNRSSAEQAFQTEPAFKNAVLNGDAVANIMQRDPHDPLRSSLDSMADQAVRNGKNLNDFYKQYNANVQAMFENKYAIATSMNDKQELEDATPDQLAMKWNSRAEAEGALRDMGIRDKDAESALQKYDQGVANRNTTSRKNIHDALVRGLREYTGLNNKRIDKNGNLIKGNESSETMAEVSAYKELYNEMVLEQVKENGGKPVTEDQLNALQYKIKNTPRYKKQLEYKIQVKQNALDTIQTLPSSNEFGTGTEAFYNTLADYLINQKGVGPETLQQQGKLQALAQNLLSDPSVMDDSNIPDSLKSLYRKIHVDQQDAIGRAIVAKEQRQEQLEDLYRWQKLANGNVSPYRLP